MINKSKAFYPHELKNEILLKHFLNPHIQAQEIANDYDIARSLLSSWKIAFFKRLESDTFHMTDKNGVVYTFKVTCVNHKYYSVTQVKSSHKEEPIKHAPVEKTVQKKYTFETADPDVAFDIIRTYMNKSDLKLL